MNAIGSYRKWIVFQKLFLLSSMIGFDIACPRIHKRIHFRIIPLIENAIQKPLNPVN
jgi:hypothetical protein